ncbi:hypothetical protein I4F81_011559 [Pyropia yezoensis]|uniref:Uncharacterized protein n=1 Tax=Pyropia yezoensis TaxID=2788 RepID=A0ACC3CFV6_PYRYE|nr:hypothetical protein I4F81_011559 [Neopyropia yezoensis]
MAFFGPQLSPMVKAVKFSLKQIDAMSKGSYTFVCCARSERGKLALLHVTDAPPGSTGRVNDNVAQAMKRLFEAVSTNNPPVERDRLPSSAGTEPAVAGPLERLDALTARQKAEVPIGDDIVASVRLKLCCGKSRRLLLADLFVFYELLAHYCKQHLNLTQVVYQHLAPVATLGISVKLVVSQMSPSRKPRPSVVSLKMVNRSKLRVPVGFSLICYMVHLEDKFFQFVLDQVAAGHPDHMVSVAARLAAVTAQQETLAGRLKRVAARLETVAARLKRAAGLLESVAARLVRAVTRLVLVPLRQEAVAARLVLVPALLEAAAVRLGRVSARLAWTAAQLKMVAARLVPAAACLLMVAAQLVPFAARLVLMEAWLVTVAEGVALVAACLVTVRAWMVPVAASQEMVATRLVPAGTCL